MFVLCYILKMSVETNKHPFLTVASIGLETSRQTKYTWVSQTVLQKKIYTYELTPYLYFNQVSLLLKFYKATQQQGERWRDYWIIDKNIFSQLRCIRVSEKAHGKSPQKGAGWIPAKATQPTAPRKGRGLPGAPWGWDAG